MDFLANRWPVTDHHISTANAPEWEALKGLNGGRWARFMDAMRQYEEV